MLYIVSVVDYGFTYSATKEVSIHRNDKDKLSDIFNSVQAIKVIFITLIFIILVFSAKYLNFLNRDYILLFIAYLIVIGQGLQSLYFFQGVEKMKFVSYFNLLSKVIYTVLIFLFIKKSEDFKLVVLFYGLTTLIPFILGFWIIKYKFNISLQIPSLYIVKQQLRDGWSLFISNISISILMNANIIILAYYVSMEVVGNFSVAEKLLVLSRAGLVVILQSTYPHICLIASTKLNDAVLFTRKVFFIILFLFSLSIPVIYFGADLFSFILTGSSNEPVSYLFQLMCFIPIIIGMNVPASQILLALNHKRDYSFIMISAAIINILSNLLFAKMFGILGTILSIYITEFFISIGLYVLIKIKYPELSFFNFNGNK